VGRDVGLGHIVSPRAALSAAISGVPVTIDSTKFGIIEAGPEWVEGRAVLNSISCKEGEAAFLRTGADGLPLRGRRGRHGLRRERAGRDRAAPIRDLPVI
jgi:hypothetical protein